jgi:hypothetical protein
LTTISTSSAEGKGQPGWTVFLFGKRNGTDKQLFGEISGVHKETSTGTSTFLETEAGETRLSVF